MASAQVASGSPGGSLRELGTTAATWLRRTSSWVQQLRRPPTSAVLEKARPHIEIMGKPWQEMSGDGNIWHIYGIYMAYIWHIWQLFEKCATNPVWGLTTHCRNQNFKTVRFNGNNQHCESTTGQCREKPIKSD